MVDQAVVSQADMVALMDGDAPYANRVLTSQSSGGLRLSFIEARNQIAEFRAGAFLEWEVVEGLHQLLGNTLEKRAAERETADVIPVVTPASKRRARH